MFTLDTLRSSGLTSALCSYNISANSTGPLPVSTGTSRTSDEEDRSNKRMVSSTTAQTFTAPSMMKPQGSVLMEKGKAVLTYLQHELLHDNPIDDRVTIGTSLVADVLLLMRQQPMLSLSLMFPHNYLTFRCPLLHRTSGDTERRYHLKYYKTSLCVHSSDSRGFCIKNGPHCAFGHGNNDLRLPIKDIK